MSRMGRRFLERQLQSEAEADPEFDQAYTEYQWASSRPGWHDRLGQCCYLIVEALNEQDRLDMTLAARFLHLAEEMAAHSICYRVDADLALARKVVGVIRPRISTGEQLPF